MTFLPSSWMPNCSMRRVILHWTAGQHKASSIDLAHYHILIEDDGKLVRGTHSIKDNVSTGDNVYAAHTSKFNTGSIGVSVCCMQGAVENPFDAGSFPMTQLQWETMAQVVAELCQFYEIPVTLQTVLGHGEVQAVHSIPQRGKWDPMVLPWNPGLSKRQVGDQFRAMVTSRMSGIAPMRETPASITAVINGKTIREAQIFSEKSYIKLRPLAEALAWSILHASKQKVELSGADSSPIAVRYLLLNQENSVLEVEAGKPEAEYVTLIQQHGFVAAQHLATALNLDITWDGETRTVTIG